MVLTSLKCRLPCGVVQKRRAMHSRVYLSTQKHYLQRQKHAHTLTPWVSAVRSRAPSKHCSKRIERPKQPEAKPKSIIPEAPGIVKRSEACSLQPRSRNGYAIKLAEPISHFPPSIRQSPIEMLPPDAKNGQSETENLFLLALKAFTLAPTSGKTAGTLRAGIPSCPRIAPTLLPL